MNSFEAIGEARLLAAEGQRQLAALLMQAIRRAVVRMFDGVARNLPQNKATPF